MALDAWYGRVPTRDHVIPRLQRRAGEQLPRGVTNIVIVCRLCNADKGSRSLLNWLIQLENNGDPRVPIVRDFLVQRLRAIDEAAMKRYARDVRDGLRACLGAVQNHRRPPS
jgi:hypothetical protein